MTSPLILALMTLAVFPVYLALRHPFLTLPLHIDTGFYVSNHTISARRFVFAKGWNAHYAGGSKWLPEWWYSRVYLRVGGSRYKAASRWSASLYNYAVAIMVGVTAYVLGDHSGWLYVAGLVAYACLSSEPQYGVYFENAEQFELAFHVLGFLLIALGVQRSEVVLVALGIGLWALDVLFVKLSSALSLLVLGIGVGWRFPACLPVVALIAAIGCAAYLGWVSLHGQRPRALLRPLIRHEQYSGHRLDVLTYAQRFLRKAVFLWEIGCSGPVIPAFAVLGLVVLGARADLLLLYLAAVAAAYLFQAAQVWYYAMPFLPVASVLAAFGAQWMAHQGFVGALVVGCLGVGWLLAHIAQFHGRFYMKGLPSLNQHVWRLYPARMAEHNLLLDACAAAVRDRVQGRSLFVLGDGNQAYVLLDAAYDTPLVCAGRWLEAMAPDWQRTLNEQWLSQPPAFLLETDRGFNPEIAREQLGLEYRQVRADFSGCRLFEFAGRVPVERVNVCASSFTRASADASHERWTAPDLLQDDAHHVVGALTA